MIGLDEIGGRLTVYVTCVWAGVDSVWEQEKPEARKKLLNRADSHTSGVRFVSHRHCLKRFCGMGGFPFFVLFVFLL